MYNKLRLFAVIMFLLLAVFTILNRHHVVQVLTLNNSLLMPKWNQIVETRKDVLLNSNKHVGDLENKYTLDWDYELKLSPWSYARKWMSTTHVHPENTPELGAVLREMATRTIISADIGTRGREFKIEVVLEGEQRAIFKPPGCLEADPEHVVEERNSGEVVAFHLGRLLEFRRTPLVVGRVLNLTEIKHVASPQLLKILPMNRNTMSTNMTRTCNIGVVWCGETACFGDGELMSGSMILWLPDTLKLTYCRHPWSRKDRARNTRGENYCFNPMLTEGRLLLDIIDTAVVEYITANIDRQMCLKLGNQRSSAMLIYDSHRIDFKFHRDLNQLKPLSQCCRIRHSTWLKLLMYANGTLSTILHSVLSKDPTAPVASREYLYDMDLRLTYTINTVMTCIRFQPKGLK